MTDILQSIAIILLAVANVITTFTIRNIEKRR